MATFERFLAAFTTNFGLFSSTVSVRKTTGKELIKMQSRRKRLGSCLWFMLCCQPSSHAKPIRGVRSASKLGYVVSDSVNVVRWMCKGK